MYINIIINDVKFWVSKRRNDKAHVFFKGNEMASDDRGGTGQQPAFAIPG